MNATSRDLVFISDNRLLAEAAGAALISEGAISSYLHARNGREFEDLASLRSAPAIVVVDATENTACAELMARIRRLVQKLPTSRIIAIGNGQDAACVTGCIESGASAFVMACDSLTELAATVKALHGGNSRGSGLVIGIVLQRIRALSAARSEESCSDNMIPLTRREIEVLELVEQGLLNKEICRKLGITLSTVKNHLHAIFEKLQVAGRRQAVRQGIVSGILRGAREQVVA
jgi:DNA-binding NarL/FixJ family response regulator